MKSVTGPWVSGKDFFDRENELRILDQRVRNGNHVLLTGQRRMGKTSIAMELGRRLKADEWEFTFADVEGATGPEDVIAIIAEAVYPIRSISSRFAKAMHRWFTGSIEEIGAYDFRLKVRAGLSEETWQQHGGTLLRFCADLAKPVLLVLDELPIFLKRMLRQERGRQKVDEFLSWLRGLLQQFSGGSLVLIVSGSIGLNPLVRRLGIPDRINYFYPFQLGPWSREATIECLNRLAANSTLKVDSGVASAVYERLDTGIPHQVQFFFARLTDHALMHGQDRVAVEDVDDVYRNDLLGPAGQNYLVHYEARLNDGLGDDQDLTIAMEILAEASTKDVFTLEAQRQLGRLYLPIVDNAPDRISEVLDILEHEGYIESCDGGRRFTSRLLKDWWAARFGNRHVPIERRGPVREE